MERMMEIKNEQQTVSQIYNELPLADRVLFKKMIELILILTTHSRQD